MVPVAENTAIAQQRYLAMGGVFEVIHKAGVGHHPHSLEDPQPIVDFVVKHNAPNSRIEFSCFSRRLDIWILVGVIGPMNALAINRAGESN